MTLEHLIDYVRGAIEGAGPWAIPMYVAIYSATCVLLIPGGILTLAAGVHYGTIGGALLTVLAANCGALAAFIIGRTFLRSWAEREMQRFPVLQSVDYALAEDGWRTVVLIRLCPFIPFRLSNYLLSATSLSLRDFTFGTLLGSPPAALLFAYLGSLGGTLWSNAEDGGVELRYLALLLAGAAALALLVRRLSQISTQQLERRMRRPLGNES